MGNWVLHLPIIGQLVFVWGFFFTLCQKQFFRLSEQTAKVQVRIMEEREKERGKKGSTKGEKQLASLKWPLTFLDTQQV